MAPDRGRLKRALNERLYLFQGPETDGPLVYQVFGSTGRLYEVAISSSPRCSCPDYTHRKNRCKHILFVMHKVLQVPVESPILSCPRLNIDTVSYLQTRERARAPSEVPVDFRHPLLSPGEESTLISLESTKKPPPPPPVCRVPLADIHAKRPPEGDCPICMDPVAGGGEVEPLAGCCLCLNTFHADCLIRWISVKRGRGGCPICRASAPFSFENQ